MPVRAQANAIKNILDRMDALANGKSSYMQAMTAAVRPLLTYAEGLAKAVHTNDPTVTPQANFLKLNANRLVAVKASRNMMTQAGVLYDSAIADLVQRENTRLGFAKGSPDRTAIIAKFSQMNQADQMQQVAAWMKDAKNGGVMLGILSTADPFLTGLTPDVAAKFRDDFVKSHAPDLANERDQHIEQHESVVAIDRAVTKISDALSDPRRVEEIQREKAEHEAANAVFAGQPPA